MKGFCRSIQAKIQSRLAENEPLIQVVIGPRQVGKTTAIRQAAPNAYYQTADSPTPYMPDVIEQWWKEALLTPQKVLVIDEVQKIEGWAEVIKKLWDSHGSTLKVILSGSAALSIEKNLKESLAGRYELIRAQHWNWNEASLGMGLSLEQYIEFGCYPGAVRYLSEISRWSDYVKDSIVEPVIGRDILQLHPVENPALLRQVFGFCVSIPAQVISLNKLQGQLNDRGAIATLQHYLNLLEKAFLVTGVQKYSPSPLRTRASSPKIVLRDNGLLRAFERPLLTNLSPERKGRYFENLVISRFIEAGWQVYYWNDRNLDVDLVVEGPQGENWAIEVKTTANFSQKDLSGLKTFCQRNKHFQPKLVVLEPVQKKLHDVECLEVDQILSLG